MKTVFISLFLTITFLFPAQENSLLWEIKGNGLLKSSYLYGTYHSNDFRGHQFGDSVLPKLLRADIVITENIDMEGNMTKKMFEYALMKDKKLEDLLNKEDYKFVKENVLAKMGKSGILFNNMKPILTMVIASQLSARKEMDFTVDEFIKNEAKKKGKKLYGLETSDEVIKALDGISLSEQSTMLVDFFKDYEKKSIMSDSMIRAYQHQDLKNLYQIYISSNVSNAFEKNLVTKRNESFVDNLIVLIKDQSAFCAIGALHLPGETGMINALRKKGYQVTPVISKYTPKFLIINDKREWFNYGNDTLRMSVNLPNDPFFEIKDNSDTINKTTTATYFYNDSIYNLKYTITIVDNVNALSSNYPEQYYTDIVNTIEKSQSWIKTKDIYDNENQIKEVEFNIAKGINSRVKLFSNSKFIYVLTVSGSKEYIYSSLAEDFFKKNHLLTPTVFLSFEVIDEITQKPLKNFQARIKASIIDTVLIADSVGYIAFSLPAYEDAYMITIISNNYVQKKVLVSTFNLNQIGESELELKGGVVMSKKIVGTNYDIYNEPVAKTIVNKTSITWDIKYIAEMKEKTGKK